MKPIEGVCAIIRLGPKFLLGKRSLEKTLAPGWWSPISGGMEPGETEAETIVRECREEIGCDAKAVKKVTTLNLENGVILHFWIVEIEGDPFLANSENSELRWFTIEELRSTPQVFQQDVDVFVAIASQT